MQHIDLSGGGHRKACRLSIVVKLDSAESAAVLAVVAVSDHANLP